MDYFLVFLVREVRTAVFFFEDFLGFVAFSRSGSTAEDCKIASSGVFALFFFVLFAVLALEGFLFVFAAGFFSGFS